MKPREYKEKLSALEDSALEAETNKMVGLSVYANDNPASDYHWMCGACYDECDARKKLWIYEKARSRYWYWEENIIRAERGISN